MNNIFYPQSSFNYNGKEIICKGNLKVFNKDFATDYQTLLNDEKVQTIYLPLDFDTEFQTFNKFLERLFSENNINTLTLTGQLKPVNDNWENTQIFNDSLFIKLFPKLKKFPVFTDNIFNTFLKENGIKAEIKRDDKKPKGKREKDEYTNRSKNKKLVIVLYFHFGIADFYKAFKKDFLKDVLADSKGKYAQLIKDKRFKVKGCKNATYKPYWHIKDYLGGYDIPVEFELIDQTAIYGDASRSLEKVFSALNIPTDTKKSLSQIQKQNIINTYEYVFDTFVNYAKNDCRIHECLLKVILLHLKLCEELKLPELTLPELTLGATTKNTFIESLKANFDENVMDFVRPFASKELSKNLSKTLALNAICNGGRAFNNNPLKFDGKGFYLDWDVMSAYVVNMIIQPYFIGSCEYYDSSQQRKIKLRAFLDKYGKNFIDRSFQIIISGKLTQNQDYFISNELPNKWYDLADYSHVRDEDTLRELTGQKVPNKEYTKHQLKQLDVNKEQYRNRGDWVQDKSVSRKHFSKELYNVIVTYDGLMWIYNHATPKLREEIMNCDVTTAMWYDKSKKCTEYQELDGSNWLSKTVGELLINEVFINRKKYDKFNPTEKPMNDIFKYMGNSLNGNFMSNLFDISNPIVGNSICGRTRHIVWLGQSIGTQETITDGGFSDLLAMVYPKSPNKLNSEVVCYLNYENDFHYKTKPLGNIKNLVWIERGLKITFEDERELRLVDDVYLSAKNYFKNANINDIVAFENVQNGIRITLSNDKKLDLISDKRVKARQFFDTLLHQELSKIFPYDHVLNELIELPHNHQKIRGFAIESKGIVERVISHGQANYFFIGGSHDNFKNERELKMRSYCLNFKNVREVLENFLLSIADNPYSVKRAKPFLITQIITPKMYSVREGFFNNKNLIIGDTLLKPCWFRECTLSGFHFQNLEQFNKWNKKQQSLKNRYGQSFEMFFTNIDGTLNYDEMNKYIYNSIKNGKDFKIPENKKQCNHPYYDEYLTLKNWCDNEYSSRNQKIFLEDLIKQFNFEIIDCSSVEIIKTDKDMKKSVDLDNLILLDD